MRFKVTTPPAVEPLSLDDAKAHLRILSDDDDPYVTDLIKGVREEVEEYTRRALITQTITLKLDAWPRGDGGLTWPHIARRGIPLPRPPLVAVQSIQYVDGNGTTQTLAPSEYQVVDSGDPAYIVPAYGKVWPTLRCQPDSVTIVYTAGYGGASAVPERAKSAMRLLMGHRDANREAVVTGTIATAIPMSVQSLLESLSCGTYA